MECLPIDSEWYEANELLGGDCSKHIEEIRNQRQILVFHNSV